MKVAYISGRYRGKDLNTVFNNVIKAREVALKYWKLGYAVICPHMNTAFMDNSEIEDNKFIEGDLKFIQFCDIIVMLDNWRDSVGAQIEHQKARELNKEIIYEK